MPSCLQLCVEHGISNDGILEDFATQVWPQRPHIHKDITQHVMHISMHGS